MVRSDMIMVPFRDVCYRPSGQAVCSVEVPPTIGGAPEAFPPGLPGGATMLPAVLG